MDDSVVVSDDVVGVVDIFEEVVDSVTVSDSVAGSVIVSVEVFDLVAFTFFEEVVDVVDVSSSVVVSSSISGVIVTVCILVTETTGAVTRTTGAVTETMGAVTETVDPEPVEITVTVMTSAMIGPAAASGENEADALERADDAADGKAFRAAERASAAWDRKADRPGASVASRTTFRYHEVDHSVVTGVV